VHLGGHEPVESLDALLLLAGELPLAGELQQLF